MRNATAPRDLFAQQRRYRTKVLTMRVERVAILDFTFTTEMVL